MVLVPKWPFFQVFCLCNIGQDNVFYNILERKNALLGYKNKKFKKSKNRHFSMIIVGKWPFFQLLFLGNIGQENVFYDILERKNAFLGYKNKTFKKSKNWLLLKRLTHGFGSKMAIFPIFFLGNIGKEKGLLWYSRT